MSFKLDLGFDYQTSFKPSNISYPHMSELFKDVPDSIKLIAKSLLSDGWSIYTVNQTRGRCYYQAKIITIPVWCLNHHKGIGYKIWYISHELAHTFAKGDNHGSLFMEQLIRICPKDYLHFELGYKPRNASKAGIVDPAKDIFKLLEL